MRLHVYAASLLAGAINARAWSSYVDFLFNYAVSNFTETHIAYWTAGPPLARSAILSLSEVFTTFNSFAANLCWS